MSGALTLNCFNQNHLKVTHPGSSSEARCCVEHPAVTPESGAGLPQKLSAVAVVSLRSAQ